MDLNEQDTNASAKSKLTPSATASSPPDGQECQEVQMFGPTNRADGRDWHSLTVARQITATYTQQQAGLICSSAVSPAKTSPSPGSGQVSQASVPASSGKLSASPRRSSRRGASLRTSQGWFLPVMGATCGPSSKGFGNAGLLSATGFSTVSISESPREGVVCSLSAVLQTQVSPRYFLSPRAATGILRRAKKRGRELPPALQAALTELASTNRLLSASAD